MRIRIVFIAIACAVSSAFATRAEATDCSGVLSTCIDDDAFWPHAGRGRFEQVGAGDTVAPRQLGFGLVTSYLSRPIVLKLRSPGGGSDQSAVNDQVNATFLWSYGVADRLELDFALPITLGQGGAGLTPVTGGGGLNDTALRDLRFGFTYSLLRRDPEPESTDAPDPPDGWSLAARLEVSAPTGDRDQFAGEQSAVFVPGFSGDVRWGRLVVGAEVGARIRPIANLLGARVGSQLVTALGASVDVLPRQLLSASIEAWALPTLVAQEDLLVASNAYVTQTNSKVLVPAEWQFSIRTSPLRSDSLSFEAGGGTAIPFASDAALTSPRFRFVLGVRWAPGNGAPPPPPAAPPPPPPAPSVSP
jgi:hypothetical protein